MKILKSYIIIFLSLLSSLTWSQNYLTNGSFELGLKNWKVLTGNNGSYISVICDTENPLGGYISAKIDMFNLEGKIVMSRNVPTGQISTININAVSGMYIIRVLTDNQSYNNKLIIN